MTAVSIILASRSPRRAQILNDAGFKVTCAAPAIDDLELGFCAQSVGHWVAALAYLKARAVTERDALQNEIVLGGDTVVHKHGQLIGQPINAQDALHTIRLLSGGRHEVWSGVALIHGNHRILFSDVATVEVGEIPSHEIVRYVDSGDWRGKAGAYNLQERLDAGWPLRCHGDPACVMGLPILTLKPVLARLMEQFAESSSSIS